MERLRHDPQFASRYREGPKLQTYFDTFNGHRGPMRDADLRRSLVQAVDVSGFVRRTLGRLAIPAHGLIPPGLLGHAAQRKDSSGSSPGASSDTSIQATISRETIELTVALHPIFFGELSAFFRELAETFREMGFVLKPGNKTMWRSTWISIARASRTWPSAAEERTIPTRTRSSTESFIRRRASWADTSEAPKSTA